MRSFAEIINSEQVNRNILEIKLKKIQPSEENNAYAKPITFDDLGEIVFDVLKIDPSQCIGYNYSTGHYDTREVKFRPGVDVSPYIKSTFEFKGHEVYTQKQMKHLTKITFRNVPFSVPDEEIIQLCKSYGTPVNNRVHYEKLFNSRNRGMMGATRWVEMELKPGTSMNNFYWLEGPLPGDVGTRVTVLHSGQDQQCSHCLRTGRGGCPSKGNGKACALLKTPRGKMKDYMTYLKTKLGYESLKSQYLSAFPSLRSEAVNNMEETPHNEDDDVEAIVPTNPIELRDAKIAELEKNVAEMEVLQDSTASMKENLKLAVKTTNMSRNKIKYARKVTEERLMESLHVPSFEDEHCKVLVQLLSVLMDEECFDVDSGTNTLKLKADFLGDIEENIESSKDTLGIIVLKERLDLVKRKLTERINEAAIKNRGRKLSVGNKDGRKRHPSGDLSSGRASSRSKSSPTTSA